jgi:hypothetical protein
MFHLLLIFIIKWIIRNWHSSYTFIKEIFPHSITSCRLYFGQEHIYSAFLVEVYCSTSSWGDIKKRFIFWWGIPRLKDKRYWGDKRRDGEEKNKVICLILRCSFRTYPFCGCGTKYRGTTHVLLWGNRVCSLSNFRSPSCEGRNQGMRDWACALLRSQRFYCTAFWKGNKISIFSRTACNHRQPGLSIRTSSSFLTHFL